MSVKKTDKKYVANTYARFNLCIKSGTGATCTDEKGNEYIDFTSGIGVNSLGFCNESWVNAVCKQAKTLNHTSNLYYIKPCADLAQMLCKKSKFENVFFANSGAEANEGAIKAARKYSYDKYGDDRYEIVTLVNSFHGRTITTLAATGQDSFHTNFMPFTQGFVYAKANDRISLENAISNKTCAIMIELVQGEGGVVALDKAFVDVIAKLAQEKDLLIIADEVQTGIGRTGKLFAFEHFNIKPDIVTLAKGLGGGLPIGAVLFGQKVCKTMCLGTHGSTFGANPIACAGAKVVLQTITPIMLKNIAEKGEYINSELLKMKNVCSVSGKGLMIGVEIAPLNARDIAEKCLKDGLLVLTAKDKLRLLPPLNITKQELKKGLKILKKVLEQENNQ